MTVNEMANEITGLLLQTTTDTSTIWKAFIKFKSREQKAMPTELRRDYYTDAPRAHIRKYIADAQAYRVGGGGIAYEITCRIDGKTVKASGETVLDAKKAFIRELHTLV